MDPVTVVLQGGYSLELDPADKDPTVQALISGAIFEMSGDRLMEVAAGGGQRVRFRASAVVAVILPPAAEPATADGGEAAQAAGRALARATGPFTVLENFLSAAEHAELLRLSLAAQDRFVPSKVDADTLNYRASLVLHDDPAVMGLVTRKILEALPMVARRLAIDMGRERARTPVIECQATAHNDGDFYRVHNDSGSPLTKHRELSYVYYFRRRSGAFTGGELRVYDVVVRDGFFDAAETYSLIEPTDNSIVFFPSHAMHEVLPVSCATRLFEDSRFSVNGWIAFEDRG